jgi:hypothetical protein
MSEILVNVKKQQYENALLDLEEYLKIKTDQLKKFTNNEEHEKEKGDFILIMSTYLIFSVVCFMLGSSLKTYNREVLGLCLYSCFLIIMVFVLSPWAMGLQQPSDAFVKRHAMIQNIDNILSFLQFQNDTTDQITLMKSAIDIMKDIKSSRIDHRIKRTGLCVEEYRAYLSSQDCEFLNVLCEFVSRLSSFVPFVESRVHQFEKRLHEKKISELQNPEPNKSQ